MGYFKGKTNFNPNAKLNSFDKALKKLQSTFCTNKSRNGALIITNLLNNATLEKVTPLNGPFILKFLNFILFEEEKLSLIRNFRISFKERVTKISKLFYVKSIIFHAKRYEMHLLTKKMSDIFCSK